MATRWSLTLLFLLLFCLGLYAAPADPAERALVLAGLFGSSGYDRGWDEHVIPEYWHPEGNESGLPGRYPDFLPRYNRDPGIFLYSRLELGRVFSGTSPWILGGNQELRGVELLFTAVALVGDEVRLIEPPTVKRKFYVMAVDQRDGKWKFVDSFPYGSGFFEIPYFLKAWEKIRGRNSVKNIPEVREKLLALVREPGK